MPPPIAKEPSATSRETYTGAALPMHVSWYLKSPANGSSHGGSSTVAVPS